METLRERGRLDFLSCYLVLWTVKRVSMLTLVTPHRHHTEHWKWIWVEEWMMENHRIWVSLVGHPRTVPWVRFHDRLCDVLRVSAWNPANPIRSRSSYCMINPTYCPVGPVCSFDFRLDLSFFWTCLELCSCLLTMAANKNQAPTWHFWVIFDFNWIYYGTHR